MTRKRSFRTRILRRTKTTCIYLKLSGNLSHGRSNGEIMAERVRRVRGSGLERSDPYAGIADPNRISDSERGGEYMNYDSVPDFTKTYFVFRSFPGGGIGGKLIKGIDSKPVEASS